MFVGCHSSLLLNSPTSPSDLDIWKFSMCLLVQHLQPGAAGKSTEACAAPEHFMREGLMLREFILRCSWRISPWIDSGSGTLPLHMLQKPSPIFTPARASRNCFLSRKGGEKTENNLHLTILEAVTNRPSLFVLCLHSYSSF